MSFKNYLGLLSLVIGISLVGLQDVVAQQDDYPSARGPESEYYSSPVTPQPQHSIAQQKSILRGQNRLARLETYRRFGLSPSRPSAVTMPFTSVSTLTWTRPRAGLFVYNSGYYRPYYYHSVPHVYPYTVRR